MKPITYPPTSHLAVSNPDGSPAATGLGCHRREHRSLCWGAILAGAVGSLAIHIVLMMLGAGLGLAMYNPLSSEHPVASLGTGAVVLQGLAAVLSLWAGGWIAGRFSARAAGNSSGCLHGFMVWCVAAIVVVSTGAGWALGDLSKVVGGGLSMAGKPAAAAIGGVTDLAQDAMDQESGMIESFLNEGLSSPPADQTEAQAIRAKRELGFALTRLAAADPGNQADRQQQVVTLLVDSQGMEEAAAREMLNEWSAMYQELKDDLAAAKEVVASRARELAEETASTLAILSLCSFVAFVVGAVAAGLGGKHGCQCACRDDAVVASNA